jgi:hypothetical protein
MATTVSIDNVFVEDCLKLLASDVFALGDDEDDKAADAAMNDYFKRYLVGYMDNKEENIKNLLFFLKLSHDDVNSSKQLHDNDIHLSEFDKTRIDTFIVSNISSTIASKWLPEFNNFNLLKKVIEGKKSDYGIIKFLIKFLLRGLRNNSFLRTVQENIDKLDSNIIKLLTELTAAIRITFTGSDDSAVLTKNLINSMKTFPTELVEKILVAADSDILIKPSELNEKLQKIIRMQKKLDKLFEILRGEMVSSISDQSSSSSYTDLDKKTANDYDLFEYLINFDDTAGRLIERTDLELKGKKLGLKCKELGLKSKDDVKEFSIKEFHKYLTSDDNTYFIRKYKDKYYGFTSRNFSFIYLDFDEF